MSAPMPMLAEVPMFELMDEHERQYLSGLLEQKHFDKGDTIFRVGDVGDCVYIVREGRVEIFLENYLGTKIILRDSGVGEVFGDISMLDNGPRTATVVAMEDTECLALDREALLEVLTDFLEANNLKVDWEGVENAPNEALVNALAMMSPYGPPEKQAMLEAPDLKTRAEILIAVTEMDLAKKRTSGDPPLQ